MASGEGYSKTCFMLLCVVGVIFVVMMLVVVKTLKGIIWHERITLSRALMHGILAYDFAEIK